MILYHICREGDKHNFQKGYVGVTDRALHKRLVEHKREGNAHLRAALTKYTDVIHYPLVEGSVDYILALEAQLRSKENTGWNIAVGGGLPPKGKALGPKPEIRGIKNYQFKGYYITPKGTFASSTEAAKANGLPRTSLWRACTQPHKSCQGRPTGLSQGFYFVAP